MTDVPVSSSQLPSTRMMSALAALGLLVSVGFATADPCAEISGKPFVPPADARACLKSFPFNETLRQNVLATSAGVLDFYTFEEYYLRSPAPFQESTINIRAQLARLNATTYAVRILNLDIFALARGSLAKLD